MALTSLLLLYLTICYLRSQSNYCLTFCVQLAIEENQNEFCKHIKINGQGGRLLIVRLKV